MFAIAFDMTIAKMKEHRGSIPAGYAEIGKVLHSHGFEWIQGSTYVSKTNELKDVFTTIYHLASIEWFRKSVRDIQAFEVQHWSDFTDTVQRFPQSLIASTKNP